MRTRSGIRKVGRRYDRHPQTIWRWYTKGIFPKPHYVNGYRQWFDDELDEHDRKHMQSYEERHASK
ncbi:hypothetical protein [Candidatus Thiodiazotropha sp. LNASS1]|uniref:hypothetical protein n=1 Tax=Candidatus Thiodiazotropha sp. LNASS1 TaxID=3096260 RepID=UPI0034DFC035